MGREMGSDCLMCMGFLEDSETDCTTSLIYLNILKIYLNILKNILKRVH